MKKLYIHRVSCRACDEIFSGLTFEEVTEKHQEHIKNCDAIKALEKVEKFRKEAEEVLGRKMTFSEATKLVVENN